MVSGKSNASRRGFSLIELVIVVVIIGIIGAIAIPRMSRGAAGATDSSLKANLAVLRNAIDLYAAEHGGRYPTELALNAGSLVAGVSGGGNALLDYSDNAEPVTFSATATNTHVYGPYLRSIPKLPKGDKTDSDPLFSGDDTGHWAYDENTGQLFANLDDVDANGVSYTDY